MQGRVVASIADEPLIPPGIRSFDIRTGRREAGSLAPGIYFYRIDATEHVTRADRKIDQGTSTVYASLAGISAGFPARAGKSTEVKAI